MASITNFSETSYNKVESGRHTDTLLSGKMSNSREVKPVSASHCGNENCHPVAVIAAVALAIFLGSIICWAVGASTQVAALEIIGKVFFSLCISAIGLTLIGAVAAAVIFKQSIMDFLKK